MKLKLPPKVQYIIEKMNRNGFEAFAVGGCVRDSIMMRNPADWDITTSARPEDVKRIFPKTIDTGIEHGTVTVLLDGDTFELTTYRIDGEYEDGRHPKEVAFTASLEEDLKRRDFTINAMAYSEETGLVDLFGGMKDLQSRIIRCVGAPEARFSEDALRILRAIRFSAQLGCKIDVYTQKAIMKLAPTLDKVSAERIQVELVKLLVSDHPQYFLAAYQLGITKVIMPEFDLCMKTKQKNPHHMYTVGEHMVTSTQFVKNDKVLRLTMLLHDMGKPETRSRDEEGIDHFYRHSEASARIAGRILKRLKFDNDTICKVKKLVLYHDYHPETNPASVRRAIYKIGEDLFEKQLEVQRADILAQSPYQMDKKAAKWARVYDVYEHIMAEDQCISLKQLAVNGKDLIEIGMQPGKQIGEMLDELLTMVLAFPHCNTKMYLLDYVQKKMKKEEASNDTIE